MQASPLFPSSHVHFFVCLELCMRVCICARVHVRVCRPTYSLPLLVFSACCLSYYSPRLLSFHLCLCSPFLFDRAYIRTRCLLPPLSLSHVISLFCLHVCVFICVGHTLPLLMFSDCGLLCPSDCMLCVCALPLTVFFFE